MYRTSIQDSEVMKQRAQRRNNWRRQRQERQERFNKSALYRADSEIRGRVETESEEKMSESTEFHGKDLDNLSDSEPDDELLRRKRVNQSRRMKQFRSLNPRNRMQREQAYAKSDLFLDQVSAAQVPNIRGVQRKQVTRNIRKIETDGIISVKVTGYDFEKRLYTISLVIANSEEESLTRCKMKLNWNHHMQRALQKVKRKTCSTAYDRFMIDVDHSFSFAPKYRSFKEFVRGRVGKGNHRSILLVGTVLTYIVSQAQDSQNPNYRVCILLLQEVFGIFN